jgi:hypothetical protein
MNRILISAGVFILVFAAALWIFFPFGIYIEGAAIKAAKNMGMPLKYESMRSGMLSTQLTGVSLGSNEIGDVTFHHTPLTLFTGSMTVDVKGIYNAQAKISDSAMEFDVTTSGKALDFIKEPVSLDGDVNIKGTINIKENTSAIQATASKMVMQTPLGEMPFENVSTDIETKGKVVTIKHLRSGDKNELDMTGNIKINKLNITKTSVNISGSIKFAGQKQNLTISGKVGNLHPVLGSNQQPNDDDE